MDLGKAIIYSGLALVAIGLVIKYIPWLVNWFGRLPGDIRIESENSTLFMPVTSMIIISVVLSIVLHLFFRR